LLLDFDGNGVQGSWPDQASMIFPEDLESATIGVGNVSQGNYCPMRPTRFATIAAAKNRVTEVWTSGDANWREQLTPYIPATTSVSKFAFQFDIYVPDAWTSTGFLGIYLYNSYNGGEWGPGSTEYPNYVYNVVPWLNGKTIEPFQTTGWQTVTIPFSEFYALSDIKKSFTFEDVLKAREKAKYSNFGIFINNSDIKLSNVTGNSSDETEFASSPTSVNIYVDNLRVVSLDAPAYSDFPDEK
jgi:hypothetical protein